MSVLVTRVPYMLIIFLIFWLPVQDLILSFIYAKTNDVLLVKSFLYAKEFLISFVALYSIIYLIIKKKLNSGDFILLIFMVLLFLYSLVGFLTYTPMAVIAELRSFIFIFFVYFIVRAISDSELLFKLIKYLFFSGIFITVFAYAELSLPEFWKELSPIGAYLRDVKGVVNLYYTGSGLPGNIFRDGVRRMVSTFADPLFFGYYFLSYILFLNFYIEFRGLTRKYYVLQIFNIVTLMVSYVRGAMVVFFISFIFSLIYRDIRLVLLAFSLFFVLILWVLVLGELDLNGSNSGHLEGFFYGVDAVMSNPLGLGLGSGGTLAGAMGDTLVKNTENALLNLMIQVGFLPIFVLGFTFFMWFKLFKKDFGAKSKILKKYYLISLVMLITMAFISPQIWAFKTGFYYFMFIGVLISLNDCNRSSSVNKSSNITR